MTKPGSLHARQRATRNLRAAPAFLTATRIDRIVAALALARPVRSELGAVAAPDRPAPAPPVDSQPRVWPAPDAETPHPAPIKRKRLPRKLAATPITAAEDVERRAIETSVVLAAPAAAPAVTDPSQSTEAKVAERRAAIAAAAAVVRAKAPACLPSALAPAAQVPSRLPISASVERPRPPSPASPIGIQDAAQAVHWLRTNGVSVKAARTTMLGTRWIVSGDWREHDTAGIVQLAVDKGFTR